jgi:hypothetical protein
MDERILVMVMKKEGSDGHFSMPRQPELWRDHGLYRERD